MMSRQMAFDSISIEEYVAKYVAVNRGASATEVRRRLEAALAAFRSGARCECGGPIWVVGSADAGCACFTCITGQSTPDHDYELDEAIRDSGS